MRVCLAFHAQSEFLDEPKCVERGITHTFQRAAARLQTREPREMRTEKLTSVKLILNHSLEIIAVSIINGFRAVREGLPGDFHGADAIVRSSASNKPFFEWLDALQTSGGLVLR